MKLSVLSFALILFLSCNQSEQKTADQTFNAEAEKSAILKVIEDETNSFYKRDYESWKQHFIQKDYAFQGWNNGDGTFDASVGWPEIDKRIHQYITDNPVPAGESSHPRVEKKNMLISFLTEDIAYLVWDQYNGDSENKYFTVSKDQRIMQKENGQWKIVNVSSFWNYKNKISVDSLK